MNTAPQLTKQDIKSALWERGILRWKCEQAEYQGRVVRHDIQCIMHDIFYGAEKNSTMVWLLSRQTGKTFFLGILALEQVYRTPKSVVKVLTDTKLHLESIFIPVMDQLLEDCPQRLKPKYDKQKFKYTFPNGSEIHFAGTDNKHYERLRGSVCHLVLVDEAGFCENLDDIVKSVLLPTTTHTGGKIVLASTPSKDPNHPFIEFIEEAEMNETLVRKTIYDNPLLGEEQVKNIIQKMGGADSPQFRREYLCEIIRDESTIVFPEFDTDLEAKIIMDWKKPPYYDAYVGMDLGGSRDMTAVLFMYYDYVNDKIIVEDEIVLTPKEMLLPKLVEDILETEERLWTNELTNEKMGPYMRVSDLNHIVTQEIGRQSNYVLHFHKAQKDDKESAINMVRVMLAQEKIIIHPRCESLVRHLSHCKWKSNKGSDSKFSRSPDNGHYDAVDALLYGIRSISFKRNPYPFGYDMNLRKEDIHVQNVGNFKDHTYQTQAQVFKQAFGKKR